MSESTAKLIIWVDPNRFDMKSLQHHSFLIIKKLKPSAPPWNYSVYFSTRYIKAEQTAVDKRTGFFTIDILTAWLQCCFFDVDTACRVTCQTLLTFCIPR